jgi:hypothetical protein
MMIDFNPAVRGEVRGGTQSLSNTQTAREAEESINQ